METYSNKANLNFYTQMNRICNSISFLQNVRFDHKVVLPAINKMIHFQCTFGLKIKVVAYIIIMSTTNYLLNTASNDFKKQIWYFE